MTTISLRERRHQQAAHDVERLTAQRDGLIDRLTRVATKLKAARKSCERYAKPVKSKAPKTPRGIGAALNEVKPPAAAPVPYVPGASMAAKIDAALHGDDDKLELPSFLRADMRASEPDAVAKEIAEQIEATRKAKSRGRIARLKADQSGERRRMPLQGKAALEAIRKG